jgi:hypothetical protein
MLILSATVPLGLAVVRNKLKGLYSEETPAGKL